MDPRVHHDPVPVHRDQDVPQDAARPRPQRPQAGGGLVAGAHPRGPLPQQVAPPPGHPRGDLRVGAGHVELGEAGLARHGDDVAGQVGVGGDVHAPVRVGVDHSVVRRQNDPGPGGDPADQFRHDRVQPLQLVQPLRRAPAVEVPGVVELADVEVDQRGAAAQGPRRQGGAGLHAVGAQVGAAAQGGAGQARAGEAGRSDRHRRRGSPRRIGALGVDPAGPVGPPQALEDRGHVLPDGRVGGVAALPGDQAQEPGGAGRAGHEPGAVDPGRQDAVADDARHARGGAGAQRRQGRGRRRGQAGESPRARPGPAIRLRQPGAQRGRVAPALAQQLQAQAVDEDDDDPAPAPRIPAGSLQQPPGGGRLARTGVVEHVRVPRRRQGQARPRGGGAQDQPQLGRGGRVRPGRHGLGRAGRAHASTAERAVARDRARAKASARSRASSPSTPAATRTTMSSGTEVPVRP